MSRAALPLLAALVVLLGSGLAAQSLHRAATGALARVTEERLRGAGTTAARALEVPGFAADPAWLRAVMEANALEGVFIVDADLRLLADATGPSGGRVDLLRVDVPRVKRAFAGEPTVSLGWGLGQAHVATAYVPLRRPGGGVDRVLLLEGGEAYSGRQRDLDRALLLAWALSALAAVAIAVLAWHWARAERRRQALVTRAVQGEAIARLGAMVAHEIRNPLSVISGTIELMRERDRGRLAARDIEALEDVLGEVDRLRQLTDDFMDLSADRPLVGGALEVGALLEQAARAGRANGLVVDVSVPPGLHTVGDGRRLRQVLLNLLTNAAQAGARHVQLRGSDVGGRVHLEVTDDGPGIPADVRERLFEPFVTTKPNGTGIGLVVSRRLIERHGGTLTLVSGDGPGTSFHIELPEPSRPAGGGSTRAPPGRAAKPNMKKKKKEEER
jgi:two-component system OmpR family sensor kinase